MTEYSRVGTRYGLLQIRRTGQRIWEREAKVADRTVSSGAGARCTEGSNQALVESLLVVLADVGDVVCWSGRRLEDGVVVDKALPGLDLAAMRAADAEGRSAGKRP